MGNSIRSSLLQLTLPFLVAVVVLLTQGCSGGGSPDNTDDTESGTQAPCDNPGNQIDAAQAETLIREYLSAKEPSLVTGYILEIAETQIPELWNALRIQIFNADFLSNSGVYFRTSSFVYHDMKVTPFEQPTGNHGVMSGYLKKDVLYYTYSWGSGIKRSHLGTIRMLDCVLQCTDSGGFSDVDLFVSGTKDDVVLETGKYESFNNWSDPEYFGDIVDAMADVAVIDEADETIQPDFPSSDSSSNCF